MGMENIKKSNSDIENINKTIKSSLDNLDKIKLEDLIK
jgi:DNA-binding transcriptional regulator WhiA